MDLAVAHPDDLLLAGVRLDEAGPALDRGGHLGRQLVTRLGEQCVDGVVGMAGGRELVVDRLEALHPAGHRGIPLGVVVVAAHRLGDLGEVAHPLRRDDLAQDAGVLDGDGDECALADRQPLLGEAGAQLLVQGGDAVVVERRRRGAEDGHVLGSRPERLPVADELAADVAEGVHRTPALELVDGDDIGEVEHVDLLELARRAELRRHDVEVDVGVARDRRVPLADAGGLDDDEVVGRGAEDIEDVTERLGHLALPPGGHRAEEDPVAVEGVHPDAVPEQGPPTATAGGVDGDDCGAELVLLVHPQPADDLVGEARLAGAAGPGDAEDGDGASRGRATDLGEDRLAEGSGLGAGDGSGHRCPVPGEEGMDVDGRRGVQVGVAGRDDLRHHAGQAEPLAVLGTEDRHARVAQPGDLVGDDDPSAAADHLDVVGARLTEQLDEVLEVLDVAALVGADRDALDVLLDRRVDDLLDGAVVAEVDDLGPLALHDPSHDVDRRVVPVEQARRGDDADRVGGDLTLRCGGGGGRGGHGAPRGRLRCHRGTPDGGPQKY